MARKNAFNLKMDEVFQAMDIKEEMEHVKSSDVDVLDETPLIEESFIEEDDEIGQEDYGFQAELEEDEYSQSEMDAFLENVNLEDDKTHLSFDRMMPAKVTKTGVQFQRKERKLHTLLVLRDLVELTPSTCKFVHCLYDSSKSCGFGKWTKVPESKKKLVLQVLQQHVDAKHKFVDDTVIDEAEIPQSWLSSTMI